MKIIFVLLATFFPFLCLACEVVDDAGHRIKLEHPAQRIISLAPDLTEILFVAGAGAHVIGVISGSDYPGKAKKIPIVGSYNSLDIEKILTLHPDLIVMWAQSHFDLELKKLGIPIYFSNPKKINDIPKTLQRLGCLTGTQKLADQAARDFSTRLALLRNKYSHKKTISVFYQVWPQPLMTISQESWINDVIQLCGGKNIFASLKGAAPEVSVEAVILANPEVIIGTTDKKDWKNDWYKWSEMTAVRNDHIFAIDPDLVERAAPRLVDGAVQLCSAIDTARN